MRLRYSLLLITLAALLPYFAKAQFVSERTAMSNIQKGKWDKAKNQLAKVAQKDSTHAGAAYVSSLYFFSRKNPDFQIDSAYAYAVQAMAYYRQTPAKQRERLLKIPFDSAILVMHRAKIDSAAFERAKAVNTEASYIDFLNKFTLAEQRQIAETLRNEAAFKDAEKVNTYQAFQQYVEKYPESALAADAKSRYERLLFESKTVDKKLATYESFLAQYPLTPYRREIEQQIFEKTTASGETQSFERFLKKYSESSKSQQAKNILYHLLKEDERVLLPGLMSDSIRKVQSMEKLYLVPFLKDDKFGFMNERGEEVIKATFKSIPDDYLCGNISDELMVADKKIITRNGLTVFRGAVNEAQPLGNGFLKISNDECVGVLHVSGFSVAQGECLQDAMVIAKNYLALKKDNKWSVWTLTGRMLIPFEWISIKQLNDVLVFEKGGKHKLIRLKELAKAADQQQLVFSKEYDEVKLWNGGLLWTKSGNEQAVLTQNLSEWIASARQQITSSFFGAVSETGAGYILHDRTTGPSTRYYRAKIQQPWAAVQDNGAWHLIDPATKKLTYTYDSIHFVGPFLIGTRGDSIQIHLSKTQVIETLQPVKAQFIPGKDSLFFLMLEENDKKTVYTIKAERLFTIAADKIEFNNEDFFTITQKQKKGLIASSGKIILPAEYDALGSISEGKVATLKDRKFGLVDLNQKKAIKPEYDKNILPYNRTVLIAGKNNLYGLIAFDNKPLTAFEYEEIKYWNDSSALVKKNFQWIVYNFVEKKLVIDKIKGYTPVLDTEEEKIMIVQQENKYGVISNKRGMIIPATFSDIVNVGSATSPLYFTEKHVEEASIFVVIYYDKAGVQLKKYVYEADDYEKIYCSGN